MLRDHLLLESNIIVDKYSNKFYNGEQVFSKIKQNYLNHFIDDGCKVKRIDTSTISYYLFFSNYKRRILENKKCSIRFDVPAYIYDEFDSGCALLDLICKGNFIKLDLIGEINSNYRLFKDNFSCAIGIEKSFNFVREKMIEKRFDSISLDDTIILKK